MLNDPISYDLIHCLEIDYPKIDYKKRAQKGYTRRRILKNRHNRFDPQIFTILRSHIVGRQTKKKRFLPQKRRSMGF